MKNTLAKLQKQIAARRDALLQEYSEYDLHQLRVSVRRLRGLLRFEGHPDAWQLRREWGFLVSQTSPARDWDTLVARIEDMPEDQQPVGLLSAVERHQHRVWDEVITALRDPQWATTSQQLQAYIDKHIDDQRAPIDREASVREASMRVNQAWEYAEKHDKPRAWHKLRIAIKDLRYNLDSLSQTEVDEPLELCKRLQDLLGTWHDSMIHHELLLIVDRDLAADEKAAKDAAAELDTDLFAEGMKALKETRHVMAARQQLLERAAEA